MYILRLFTQLLLMLASYLTIMTKTRKLCCCWPPGVLFEVRDPVEGTALHLVVKSPLSSNLEQSFFVFRDLDTFKEDWPVVCRILQLGFVWCFLIVNLRFCSFDNHRSAAVLCDIRRYMHVSMSHYWWHDTDLHHLVKVVFAWFFYKATIFLLVNSKYLVGRYFETVLTFCFLYFDSQILVSIGDACLQQLWLATNGDSCSHHPFCID